MESKKFCTKIFVVELCFENIELNFLWSIFGASLDPLCDNWNII